MITLKIILAKKQEQIRAFKSVIRQVEKMSYIDYDYYANEYHGANIPSNEFDRIAEIASTTIDAMSYSSIDESKPYFDSVKKATAYEAEAIYAYGGEDVAYGLSAASIGSESLGDYSYSANSGIGSSSDTPMYQGVPISPIALSMLSKAGLRNRWAYAYDEECGNDV